MVLYLEFYVSVFDFLQSLFFFFDGIDFLQSVSVSLCFFFFFFFVFQLQSGHHREHDVLFY